MGIEDCKILGRIDPESLKRPGENNYTDRGKWEEKSVTLEQMHAKAEEVIEKNKIKPEEFLKIYGASVAEDTIKAEKLKEKFASRMDKNSLECKQYAEVMEGILANCINSINSENNEKSLGWLGEEVSAMNTTDYDDLENGIDIVTEMTKEGGYKKHLGLAMDATFSNKISDKFRGIKGEIVRGELAELKYFKSGNFKGSLSQIPHVVIGVSLGKIKELGKMWVNGDVEGLRNHPVQYQILEEMIIQLETFEKYALKCGKEDLAKVYRDNCETLKQIKAEKEKVLPDTGERDHIFENIKKEMDNFMNDRRR